MPNDFNTTTGGVPAPFIPPSGEEGMKKSNAASKTDTADTHVKTTGVAQQKILPGAEVHKTKSSVVPLSDTRIAAVSDADKKVEANRQQAAERMKTAGKGAPSASVKKGVISATTDTISAAKPSKRRQLERSQSIQVLSDKNQIQLPVQSDLKTAQGLDAQMHAFMVQQSITSAMANASNIGVDVCLNGEAPTPSPGAAKATFKALTGCLGDVVKGADIANTKNNNKNAKNDCHLLNNLAGLMQKGFQPYGGAGCFLDSETSGTPKWDPAWSKIGNENSFKWDTVTDISWKDAGFTLDQMKAITGNDKFEPKDMDLKLKTTDFDKMSSGDKKKVSDKIAENNVINAAKNAELKLALDKMINYFEKHTDRHFDPAQRTIPGVTIASVQLAAVLGQLIHDFVLDEVGEPSGKGLLKDNMVAKGLIDPAKFARLQTLEKAMRDNPLLAEVGNQKVKEDLALELGKAGSPVRGEMLALIQKEIDPQNKLPPLQREHIADEILKNFIDEIGKVKSAGDNSGERGRAPGVLKPLGKHIAGVGSKISSIAEQPNRADDVDATNLTKTTLGTNPKVKQFHDAIEGGPKILTIGGSPTTVLRYGTGLDSGLKESFVETPAVLLKKAVETTIKTLDQGNKKTVGDTDAQIKELQEKIVGLKANVANIADPKDLNRLRGEEAIKQLDAAIKNLEARKEAALQAPKVLQTYNKGLDATNLEAPQNKALGTVLGKAPVTFNKATRQQLSLAKFATDPTVAGIMAFNNLRTICSISGTTVDAVIGIMAKKGVGEETMKKFLQPLHDHALKLREHAKSGKPPPPPAFPDTPEGRQCKQLISEVSMFMHTGKYHTQGEVIGGLFIASRALFCSKDQNTDIEETFELFKGLAKDFSENPLQYNAVEANDRALILDPNNIAKAKQTFMDKNKEARQAHGQAVAGLRTPVSG